MTTYYIGGESVSSTPVDTTPQPTPIEELNTTFEQNVQNVLNESRALNLSTLQSTPGISPYGLGQSQLNYEAQVGQKADQFVNSSEARGNYAYDVSQSALDLQTQLANQQLAIQKAQQNSQFWGSVLGSASTLAAVSLFSSEENKEGIVEKNEPRVNEVDSNVPQRYLDTWANYLTDNKENLYKNGANVENISQSPLSKSLITQDEGGNADVDYGKLVGALSAGIGDAHDKLKFLNEDKPIKNFNEQTKDTEEKTNVLTQTSNKIIANLVKNELEYQKAVQDEGLAYAAKLEQLQKKYPTQSIADIQNSLTATQRVMQAFAFLAGGVAQGLTGASQNPGVQAYNRSVDNLLQTNEVNYQKQLRAADYIHGETLTGLKTQFDINRDMANITNGQIKDIKNVLNENLKRSQNALEFQIMSQEAYDKTSLLRSQQEAMKTDMALKKMQLLATLAQQDMNPLSVKITNTDTATAKSVKSAELLNSQLPILNARINELKKLNLDVQKKQNLDEVAARFRQIGFGTPDKPDSFKGNDEEWEKSFGKTQGLFVDRKALKNLQNAVFNTLNQTQTYKDELISRNTVAPSKNLRDQSVVNSLNINQSQGREPYSSLLSSPFRLQPQDVQNIRDLKDE